MGASSNYAKNAAQEQAARRAVHDLALKSEKARKLSFAGFLCSVAPRPGLEPGTCGLTATRAAEILCKINVLKPKNSFVRKPV
jgi:hypothetical protein